MHNEIDSYKKCKDLQNLLNITLFDVIKPLREALKLNPSSKIIGLEIKDAENKAYEYIATQITNIGNANEIESERCLTDFPKSDVCYRCIGLDDDTIEGLLKIRNMSFVTFLNLEDDECRDLLTKYYLNVGAIVKIKVAITIIKNNINILYSNDVLTDNTRDLIKLVTRLVDNKCTVDDIDVIGIPDWHTDAVSEVTLNDTKSQSSYDDEHSPDKSQFFVNSDHKSASDYHPSSFISTKKPINIDTLFKAVQINVDERNLLSTNFANHSSLSVPNTPNATKSRSVGGSEEILNDIGQSGDKSALPVIDVSPLFCRKKYPFSPKSKTLKNCSQLQRSLSHEFESNLNIKDCSGSNNGNISASVFQFNNDKSLLDKERRSSCEEKVLHNNAASTSEFCTEIDHGGTILSSKGNLVHKFESENKFGLPTIVKPPICAVCKIKRFLPKLLSCENCKIKVHKNCAQMAYEIACSVSPIIERNDCHNSAANIPTNYQGSDSNSASSCNSSPASPFNLESGYNSSANNHISPRHPNKRLVAQNFEFSVIDETDSAKYNSNDGSVQKNDEDTGRISVQNRVCQRLESTESQDEYSRLSRNNSISVTLKEWEIPLESLKLGDLLGRGSFSNVYRAKWHGEVAVKIIQLEDSAQDERDSCMSAFKSEVGALHKTRHENLVLFMGACMKPPKLAIITQLSQGETLYHQLHSKHMTFPMIRAINIASQVAKGMGYLHAKNILHKDLKSRNIFIENNYKAVISDFGLFDFVRMCKQARSGSYLKIPHGWLCYLSPELIRNLNLNSIFSNTGTEDLPFTKFSDIYAFGTIWFEILNNKWPYEGLPSEAIIYKVGKGIKESLKMSQPKEFKDLLLLCWSSKPSVRPPFTNIVQLLEKLPKLQRSPSYPVKSVTIGRNHDNLMT